MGNRKAAMARLLELIEKLLPGSENTAIYEERLGALSDEQFGEYMQKLRDGEETLFLIAPNLDKPKLTLENNLKLAEELGHNFFERLWLTDPKTHTVYLTPVRSLIVDLPLRRQQQLLREKISIPEDNHHVDELTGQPTGPSKGSKLSFPEVQVLYAQGLDRSIEELMKFRGGDTKAFQAMNRSIIETGGASLDAIKRTPTKVKSTETLKTLLTSAHLKNTL